MEYLFKRFSKDLIEDFRYIYDATNDKKLNINIALKKFDTTYFGVDFVGFIAYSKDGEPSAYYGVFPLKIIQEDKVFLIAQSGDTMTHPNHRNQGLFRALFNATANLAYELGIKYFIGFPNDNSYPGFVKFGWNVQFNSHRFSIPVKMSFVQRVKRKLSPGVEFQARKLFFDKISVSYKELLNCDIYNASKNYYIKRDENYFMYKSYSSSFIIKLKNGYVWIKPDQGRLNIGDVFPLNQNASKKILKEIRELASQLYFTEIVYIVSPNSEYKNAFFKEYIPKKSLPLITYKIDKNFDFNGELIEYSYADFDTF